MLLRAISIDQDLHCACLVWGLEMRRLLVNVKSKLKCLHAVSQLRASGEMVVSVWPDVCQLQAVLTCTPACAGPGTRPRPASVPYAPRPPAGPPRLPPPRPPPGGVRAPRAPAQGMQPPRPPGGYPPAMQPGMAPGMHHILPMGQPGMHMQPQQPGQLIQGFGSEGPGVQALLIARSRPPAHMTEPIHFSLSDIANSTDTMCTKESQAR